MRKINIFKHNKFDSVEPFFNVFTLIAAKMRLCDKYKIRNSNFQEFQSFN